MIKAILFDFDGVLTTDHTGSQSTLRFLAAATGVSEESLKREYYKYNRALLDGQLTHREMWQQFCDGVGVQMGFALLTQAFRSTPLDPEMIALAKELKQNFKIGLVTDNKCDRIGEILSYYRLTELFDAVSVSAACGSGKEEREIFDRILSQLGVLAEECVFIDNSPKNLAVPGQMGMKTILFDADHRDIKACREAIPG